MSSIKIGGESIEYEKGEVYKLLVGAGGAQGGVGYNVLTIKPETFFRPEMGRDLVAKVRGSIDWTTRLLEEGRFSGGNAEGITLEEADKPALQRAVALCRQVLEALLSVGEKTA